MINRTHVDLYKELTVFDRLSDTLSCDTVSLFCGFKETHLSLTCMLQAFSLLIYTMKQLNKIYGVFRIAFS